jgi:hypothetical protein
MPPKRYLQILTIVAGCFLAAECPNPGPEFHPQVYFNWEGPLEGQVGQEYLLVLRAFSQARQPGPNAYFQWSITGRIPPGLEVCAEPKEAWDVTCRIKGTPLVAGEFGLVVNLVQIVNQNAAYPGLPFSLKITIAPATANP